MQAKASGQQTLWVLLMAFLLVVLCAGGLWAYVQNADAETGVQEASATELPEEDEITVTWEKYDNYPPTGKEDDLEQKFTGTGLTKEEKQRLPALIEAYTQKTGPDLLLPAQPLPGTDGLAIVPLDPSDYAGMTEYYILPAEELNDQQLMQLIDYSAKKGETFTADMLTSKNCMRGGYSLFNRYLSAGEADRQKILASRILMEGLWPDSPELSIDKMPVKGMGSVSLMPDKHNEKSTFYFFPIRVMTDEELLLSAYKDFIKEGFTYLKPAEQESLNPAKDVAKARAILEEFMGMPKATENYLLSYKRKDATGEIRLQANFNTATVNGERTTFSAIMDPVTGSYISLDQFTWFQTVNEVNAPAKKEQETKTLSDSELIVIAKAIVEKVTNAKAISAETTIVSTTTSSDEHIHYEPTMPILVSLEDGSQYSVRVQISDGIVEEIYYNPKNNDDFFFW